MSLDVKELGTSIQLLDWKSSDLPLNKPGDSIAAFRTAVQQTECYQMEFISLSFLEDFSPANPGAVQPVLAAIARFWQAYCLARSEHDDTMPFLVIPEAWQAHLKGAEATYFESGKFKLCPVLSSLPKSLESLRKKAP